MYRMMPSHHHPLFTICTKLIGKSWSSDICACRRFSGRAPSVMCHMRFVDESALIAHYDTAHAPSRGRPRKSRLQCEVCGIKFADSSNKRRHIRSASATCDVNMFQCDFRTQCGVHFVFLHRIDLYALAALCVLYVFLRSEDTLRLS